MRCNSLLLSVSLPAQLLVLLDSPAVQELGNLLLRTELSAVRAHKVLDGLLPAGIALVHKVLQILLPGQTHPCVRVLLVVVGAQEFKVGLSREESVDFGVSDLGQLGRLPLGCGPRLADEQGRNALDKVWVLHELACHGVLATESLGNGPPLTLAKLLESDANGSGRTLCDGLLGLRSPLLDFLEVRQNALVKSGKNLLDVVVALEYIVDAFADLTTDGLSNGLVVGKTGGELFDRKVDDLQALVQSCGVLELQLTKTGLKVGKGGRVEVVGCDAGVAAAC
jgi:hypothetical protein